MNRRITLAELGVLCSWLLLAVTATIMGASSPAWLGFLWALYGNRNWPLLTEVYLSSVHWFWIIPLVAGIPIWILWSRGRIERMGAALQVLFHALSLAIFIFSAIAAFQPFRSSTFGMQGGTRAQVAEPSPP